MRLVRQPTSWAIGSASTNERSAPSAPARRGHARRGLSLDQVDDAIRLYDIGWSLARIGEHLRVDPTTVLNRLRERGIPTRDTHGRPPS